MAITTWMTKDEEPGYRASLIDRDILEIYNEIKEKYPSIIIHESNHEEKRWLRKTIHHQWFTVYNRLNTFDVQVLNFISGTAPRKAEVFAYLMGLATKRTI